MEMDEGTSPWGRGDSSPYHRPAPVFVGFEEGHDAWIGALYEFTTAAGQYVYLHETSCVDMQYRPQTRQLVLTFACVDSEVMDESVVVLVFDDAEVYQWETPEREPLPAGELSLVRAFDCLSLDDPAHAGVSFHLHTDEAVVAFFASSVTCDVRAGRWAPAVPPH